MKMTNTSVPNNSYINRGYIFRCCLSFILYISQLHVLWEWLNLKTRKIFAQNWLIGP